ncbi:MAG: winged helix-turn-helix domain-containing protein [Streptosporangiaceae bacterium]
MDYNGVHPGDLAVGARLVSVPGVPSPPEDADGDEALFPWKEHVPPPGTDGTLLAVVPIPGTGTSLAIVGYAIATSPQRPPESPPSVHGLPGQHQPGQHQPGQHQTDRKRTGRKHGAGLRLDHVQRRVWVDGREITLTYQEFELLAFLSAHPATVFSRADLVGQVWRRDIQGGQDQRPVTAGSRTVDVHISRLRQKLGPRHGQCLVTEYRFGYQFRPPAP